MEISPSIADLNFSVIREMGLLAAKRKDTIQLGIGEPDFTTPLPIIQKAFADAQAGHTHYTASKGDPELLEKLAAEVSRDTRTTVSADQILVTHGGMGGLAAAMRTLLEPGDEVLVIEPHFPDYLAHIALARGYARGVPTALADGFIPRPEEIEKRISPKTRLLVLNSPNNPTGAVLPAEVLDAVAAIVREHGLMVISDEVYDKILFRPPFESIFTRPGMAERTLVIKSFSKSHAMTGWRVGYCYGPLPLIAQMLKVVNYSTACASSLGQRGAIAALELDPHHVEEMKQRFAERIEFVHARLKSLPGVKVVRPQGSFYIFADISAICKDSRTFALELLDEQGVVVIPGYAFGASGEGCIRLACTQGIELLATAMERLANFIEQKGRSAGQ